MKTGIFNKTNKKHSIYLLMSSFYRAGGWTSERAETEMVRIPYGHQNWHIGIHLNTFFNLTGMTSLGTSNLNSSYLTNGLS